MAFMTAELSLREETWCLSDDRSFEFPTCLPDGDYHDLSDEDFAEIAESLDDPDYSAQQIKEDYQRIVDELGKNAEFTIVTGYRGYLSASGYLDRTDPVICSSQQEVAKELIALYYDRPDDELDEGEKNDRRWLESIVAGNVITL